MIPVGPDWRRQPVTDLSLEGSRITQRDTLAGLQSRLGPAVRLERADWPKTVADLNREADWYRWQSGRESLFVGVTKDGRLDYRVYVLDRSEGNGHSRTTSWHRPIRDED